MKSVELRRQAGRFVPGLVVLALVPSCSPGIAAEQGATAGVVYGEAQRCEDALQHLDTVIAARGAAGDNAAPELVEARELRSLAAQLYLQANYELALEFINDALAILRAPQP